MDENEEIVTTIYDNVSRQYSWKSKVCDQYEHMFNSFMCKFGTWRCDISPTDCPLYVFIQVTFIGVYTTLFNVSSRLSLNYIQRTSF